MIYTAEIIKNRLCQKTPAQPPFEWPHSSFLTSRWRNLGKAIIWSTVKLRHCDVKNALLAAWSLKTNAASFLLYQSRLKLFLSLYKLVWQCIDITKKLFSIIHHLNIHSASCIQLRQEPVPRCEFPTKMLRQLELDRSYSKEKPFIVNVYKQILNEDPDAKTVYIVSKISEVKQVIRLEIQA